VSRKWIVIIAVLTVDLIIAITVVAIVLDRERDDARRAAAAAATSTTGITSPYDFTELPGDVDLDLIEDASFVSILMPDENGKLTSYGVSMDLPAARAVADGVRNGKEVDAETAGSILGSDSTGAGMSGSDGTGAGTLGNGSADAALTFVLPDHETITFVFYWDEGLIARRDRAWRVDDDLRALIEAATVGPQ
jgi:hypothetical protein